MAGPGRADAEDARPTDDSAAAVRAADALAGDVALVALCRRVRDAGGRILAVGGGVRDALLGRASRDLDLELFGLAPVDAHRALGAPPSVGAAFPVWLVALDDGRVVEVSLGGEHADAAAFARAARRRDLRCNAIGFDPLARAWLDPWEGRADLAARRLRATDAARFGDDPLRALRVARLAAVLDAEPDGELEALCARQDLAGIPAERVFAELDRLLLADDPARGLDVLARTRVLRFFAPLIALAGVPQDARWHPEGCVWTHTVLVVREAGRLRTGDRDRDRALLWGALCHDLGKPATTRRDGDAVRALGHEVVGERIAREWLASLRAPAGLARAVAALVRHHLAPSQLARQRVGDAAHRRLVRALAGAGVDAALLERLARADALGRTTPDALARRFAAGDAFLARVRALAIERAPRPAAVRGRDVVARGVPPGPEVGRVLARCRAIEDETGWSDGARVLARALAERGRD